MMRSVLIKGDTVICTTREAPRPASAEILVHVRAAGVNGADILQWQGRYPATAGQAEVWPGLEFAGEVVDLGDRASRFSPGDRVMGIVTEAGQGEYVAVDERAVLPVPEIMTWTEAGGFPETFSTAFDALFSQCGLRFGERLLVTGAAGGVGVAAVQLGLAAGAQVTASVRSKERQPQVAALGAEALPPEEAIVRGPFDVILELVGAPNLPAAVAALAPLGRIAVIGTGAGSETGMDLRKLMASRGRIHGSTLRARLPEEKAMLARSIEHQVLPLVTGRKLRVVVDATFPLEDGAAAYERFAAGEKFGKIILELAGQ